VNFFEELKRRNVIRVGVAYLLLAWVVIQVTDTVGPALHLPDWTLTFVIWVGIIGLPFALFFAWAFELTPEGLKREEDVDRSNSVTKSTGRRINAVVVGLLLVAVVLLLADKFAFEDGEQAESVATTREETAESGAAYDSIGVLPFVNMSDDPSQEYFSDGIAEELLNALAKLKDLQVAARTSSFAFKGQNQDIMEIGRKLNVDTMLEGSVRKSGSKLRITAQLIDVADGYHLWSETYDRQLTDIFEIQDEITAAIVDALLPHFETGESQSVAHTEVTNMSAYDAYLQGRHAMRERGDASVRKALRLFRAATEADPEFAPAWAARAMAVVMLREDHFREGIPREESHLLARNSIDRALAIDPMLAEAYVAEGVLLADDYEYEAALQSLEKALEINPNLAEAWVWRARLLERFGRIQEAQEDIKRALDLDPHNSSTADLAGDLASSHYDPGFFTIVKRAASQFPRVRQQLELTRMQVAEPLTTESYNTALAMPDVFPGWQSLVRFWALKELDEEALGGLGRNAGDFAMWLYIHTGQWDKAQAMYDALPPERQNSVLNLEELSVMQAAQGKFEQALGTLRRAHGDAVPVYGQIYPNQPRSNINLALNRVFCLRRLGREAEAREILDRARIFVDTLRENTVYGIYKVDAKLRILDGDTDGALDMLAAALERNELEWTARWDPVVSTLSDDPRFTTLFAKVDADIDALRAELGMPPAKLR